MLDKINNKNCRVLQYFNSEENWKTDVGEYLQFLGANAKARLAREKATAIWGDGN